jgi:chromosome partitioning protein
METLAVINQKGGCSKTTTSVNMAATIAAMGFKTLLVDMDPQSNLSQSLGIVAFDMGTPNLFEDQKTALNKCINETSITNLYIIPSDLSLAQVEWELLKTFKGTHTSILRDKLKENIEEFDYCIIDCPPSLGIFSLNALIAADRVLIPVGLDPFGLIGIKYLVNTITDIRMSVNKQLKILGIARTMWDMRQRLGREISGSIERDYPGKVLETIIKMNVSVKESAVAQMPLVNYDPSAPAAIQYKELTTEVLQKW